MRTRPVLLLPIVLTALVAGAPATAPESSVVNLLDRYGSGDFEVVVRELTTDLAFDAFLRAFERDAPVWIIAESDRRPWRELVAATVALEAAHAGLRGPWKWTQRQPRMCSEAKPDECYDPRDVLQWKAPPLLLEWGCELFRTHEKPQPIERWWQLAALAVAQRSEDTQFLVGDPQIGKGQKAGEIGNLQREIKHLEHVIRRFPNEKRFMLAEGIARDRAWPQDAILAYGSLERDPDVAGEAMMRLGAMLLRQNQTARALPLFERANTLTRDPYVVYLARYFSGQAHQRQSRPREAEAAFRTAAAAVPHAQSATLSLAALLFRDGRRAHAHRIVDEMLAVDPPPADPWRAYVHADYRFWPDLIGKLRAEIRK